MEISAPILGDRYWSVMELPFSGWLEWIDQRVHHQLFRTAPLAPRAATASPTGKRYSPRADRTIAQCWPAFWASPFRNISEILIKPLVDRIVVLRGVCAATIGTSIAGAVREASRIARDGPRAWVPTVSNRAVNRPSQGPVCLRCLRRRRMRFVTAANFF